MIPKSEEQANRLTNNVEVYKVNLIDVLFIVVYKISSIQYSAEFRKKKKVTYLRNTIIISMYFYI
jgi:hypothetical protein